MTERQAIELASLRRIIRSGEARRLRLDSELSQLDVADAVNVCYATISRWETGKRRPRGRAALRYWRLLAKLAETLEAAGATACCGACHECPPSASPREG